MRKPLFAIATLALLASGAFASMATVGAADHADAPNTKNAALAAADITDTYLFGGAGPQQNVVMALSVNGLTTPGDQVSKSFDPDATYAFRFDNSGDAVEDVTFFVSFGPRRANGTQEATVRMATGGAAVGGSAAGEVVVIGSTTAASPGATANAPVVTLGSNGEKLFAGWRDDPFYFDLVAFQDGLKFRSPGVDTFAGTNVQSIVLEVPRGDLLGATGTTVGFWGTTHKGGRQIDRFGRPAINTVFIASGRKDIFNSTRPSNDLQLFKTEFVAALNSLGSNPALADVLLPDVMTTDLAKPFRFLNGRAPADDVIDAELQVITGNSKASDNVGANDRAFLSSFPYLAEPWQPAGTAAAGSPASTGITPPRTGDGGLIDDDGLWRLSAALFVAALALGGAGVYTAVRSRGR